MPSILDDNWNRAWNQPYTSIYSVRPNGSIGASPMTAPSTFGSTPALDPVIQGLLTPGLVPDIARQSAEIAGGRGVAGSPAGASTAVRMSEQNWLQRLALANSLLSGEASRELPYQITPYQRLALETQERIGRRARTGGSPSFGGGGGGGSLYPFANMNFGGGSMDGGGSAGGSVFGGGGGAGIPETLNDVYDWLGFGDFGSLPGDETFFGGQNPEAPDFGSLTPGMPDLDWDF